LLVPLVTGNVNTTWAVWRATEDATGFKRLEELSGVSIGHNEDGFVVTQGRSSAASWTVGFWTFDGEDLEPLVDALVTAQADGTGQITDTACEIVDRGGLADLGLDATAAQAKFCGDPAVAGIFQ
jgi:hypothetical protein